MSPFQPSLGSPSPVQSPSCMPWAAGEAALGLRWWAVQPQQDSEGKATALPVCQAPGDQGLCSASQGRLGGLGWWGPFLALLGNPHPLLVSPPIEEQRAHKLTGLLTAGTVCAASILCHQSSVALMPQLTWLLLHCPEGSQTRVSRVWVLLGSWALSVPQLPLPYQEQPRTGALPGPPGSWARDNRERLEEGGPRPEAQGGRVGTGSTRAPCFAGCGALPALQGVFRDPVVMAEESISTCLPTRPCAYCTPPATPTPPCAFAGQCRGVCLTCTQANLQVRPQAQVPEQAGWPSPPLHPPAAGSQGKVGVKRLLIEEETEAQEGHGPDTA